MCKIQHKEFDAEKLGLFVECIWNKDVFGENSKRSERIS